MTAAIDPRALAARRLGLYGGSFDPPHDGHLHVLRAAREAFALDHVVLVPAGRPPHKPARELAPAEDRAALCELLVEGEPATSVWRGELERPGPSYSIDTVLAFEEARGGRGELFWILGADSLAGFARWRRVEELVRRAAPIVVRRPREAGEAGCAADELGALSAEARALVERGRVDAAPHPASSSAIRAALAGGEAPEHLPSRLVAHVRARGLYAAPGERGERG